MPQISTDELISGILNGQPVTPYPIDEEVIDRHIKLIQQKRIRLNTDSAHAKALKLLTEEAMLFVLPERKELLAICELYVLPMPICVAYCEVINGKKRIVIGSGILDLICHSLFLAHFGNAVPQKYEDYFLLKFPEKLPFIDLFINALFLLEYRFYCFAEPLPNLRPFVGESTLKSIRTSMSGAAAFILLHELGHLQLGHVTSNVVRPVTFRPAIPEQLNVMQQQELEADQFVTHSLYEQARALATFWQHQDVAFYSQLELLSGKRSEDHPLAINRSAVSDTARGNIGKEFGLKSNPQHFETLRERFLATEVETQSKRNMMIQTTRAGCMRVIE
tara:strand:+ start:4014 stop:5015 length:1002 start_codon:yes stop_codon:yes gene_type:complete